MVSYEVLRGRVGVSYNPYCEGGSVVLLQVTDETDQARAALTVPQAKDLIARLQQQVERIENDPLNGWTK